MSHPRLLVVEPDQVFAGALAQMFNQAGFLVRVALDASSGQDQAAVESPDLIVVDFSLPGPGGPAFVNVLRSMRPRQPLAAIFMVTPEAVSRALNQKLLGLEDFVVKPTYGGALLERVRVLLHRQSHLPDMIRDISRYVSYVRSGQTPQRITLTVLFSDVRSFTSLSETRDPETVAAALNDLFTQLADSVIRFGGTVDKFMGDGMMALFGIQPDTQHALAAVRASRDILTATAKNEMASLLTGADFSLGIGINTGPVVLGPIGPPFAREVTAIGDTVNTSARLCGVAKPGEIVISQSTYDEVRDHVEVLDRRETSLRGKRAAQHVYCVETK